MRCEPAHREGRRLPYVLGAPFDGDAHVAGGRLDQVRDLFATFVDQTHIGQLLGAPNQIEVGVGALRWEGDLLLFSPSALIEERTSNHRWCRTFCSALVDGCAECRRGTRTGPAVAQDDREIIRGWVGLGCPIAQLERSPPPARGRPASAPVVQR